MENQMTEDGSLRSVPQVESPILTGGLVYDGNGELPEPQSSDEIIAAATGSEVGVYSSGTLVKQGTILTGETIASGANDSMYVDSGGTAKSTTVNGGGSMTVFSGGTANSTTVNSRGYLWVSSGGTANDTTVNDWGDLYVDSGGTANDTTVNSSGYLCVYPGGTANATTVNDWGDLYVDSGGTANSTTVKGSLDVGGTANSTTVNGGGSMTVFSGGTANSTTVKGSLYVYSGGTANSTTVNGGGSMTVFSGGTALNIVENGGYVDVAEGASVTFTPNTISGLVLSYTSATLHSGTTANSTTVKGSLDVYSGGTANSTTVNYWGGLYVSSGGTANATTVNSWGFLYVSSGGTHRGSLQIEAGAIVSAFSGATIDFSVAERTVADDYLINDLSLISGAPTYTITVATDQTSGTYKLAQGAGSFAGTLSVGDGNVAYGSVTVNGEDLVYNGVNYSLDQVGGNLTLTIGGAGAPAAVENDLDGNGLADTILRHTLQGYCGAWLTEDSTIRWGNLSNIGNDVKLLGMGNISGSSDSGLDIYMLNGDTVAAWVTKGGKVTGYQSLYKHNANMNVLGLADFDGDGVTDYLLRSNTGDVGCIMGDGNHWKYFQSLGKEWNIAATGDFNGDGRDDLILKHDAGFAGTWLTQENGSVKWADLDTLSGGLEIIGSGDFNGDGTDDVLLRKGKWVGAWLVEEGSVDSFMGIKNNLTSTVEQIADFDGDGIDDLRVREGSDIGVLYVKGADTTQWQYFKSVGSEWSTAFDAQVV